MLRVLKRIAGLEPVVLWSLVGATVTVGGVWGVDLTGIGGQVGTTLEQLVLAAGWILTVLGVRSTVTPAAAVVARVDDPTVPPDRALYLAGGYADAPTGASVSRQTSLYTTVVQ